MYIVLRENTLHELVKRAIEKAGSIRKLVKQIKVPRSTLHNYYHELRTISKSNLDKIENYAKIKIKERDILRKLPINWKQIKGGKKRVLKAKKEGKFEEQLSLAREKSKSSLGLWHKKMKAENKEAYYKMQYERFKKIGGYKYKNLRGEKVRNNLERETANWLIRNKIDYEFEPMIEIEDRRFFPDFVINDKIIIECTMWRGYDKAVKLKEKIEILEKKYKVFVLIPERIYKYYRSIKENIVFNLEEIKEARFK